MLRKILWGIGAVVALFVAIGALFYFDRPLMLAAMFKPWHAFDASKLPPAPDYTKDDAWAALPGVPSNADIVPPDSGAADNQAKAGVDVFFIHPTTYLSKNGWNAPYDEGGKTREQLESGVLRFQASAFNGCCRIFAPRYRQATLYSFVTEGEEGYPSFEVAYQDVARAFDEFIAHRNSGRPFIIASHSQGSLHGMRLIAEKIVGTPLEKRFVAAYLIGSSAVRDSGTPGLVPCATPTQTGCYINWNSVLDTKSRGNWTEQGISWIDGRYQRLHGRTIACVNPLTWTLDGEADASTNLGGMPFAKPDAPVSAPEKALTGARCEGGLLVVSPANDAFNFGSWGGDFHIYDYNLFYMNIRANLAARAGQFLKSLGAQ